MDAFGISQSNADILKKQAEEALIPEARADVAVDKANSPAYQSVNFVDALNERLKNASKNSIKNPKNLEEVFKNQGGDVNVNLSDGTTANFRYGDYDLNARKGKGMGFVGKKVEIKHPNVATPDFEDKIRNAKLVEVEPNGRRTYITRDNDKVVVGRDGEIITAYKIDGNEASSQTLWEPRAYDEAFQPQTSSPKANLPQQSDEVNLNKAFALPSKQQTASEMERLYNVYSMNVLEGRRRTLNKAIKEAAKKEDDEALAALMQQKEVFDDTLNDLANANRFEGDVTQYDKLLQAREKEAEYNRLFENYRTRNAFGQNTLDLGAKEFLQLLGTDLNYTPSKFAKTLGLSDTKKAIKDGLNAF